MYKSVRQTHPKKHVFIPYFRYTWDMLHNNNNNNLWILITTFLFYSFFLIQKKVNNTLRMCYSKHYILFIKKKVEYLIFISYSNKTWSNMMVMMKRKVIYRKILSFSTDFKVVIHRLCRVSEALLAYFEHTQQNALISRSFAHLFWFNSFWYTFCLL